MAERGAIAIKDAEQLKAAVDAYFKSLQRTRYHFTGNIQDGEKVYEAEEYMKPPTTAGLALALNVDRRTLIRYLNAEGTRDAELSPVLARAWTMIAEWWEEALAVREASNGARFTLEANFGYGKEDRGGGAGFQQTVITPAPEDQAKAIPVWKDD